jgi:hypothetical protein
MAQPNTDVNGEIGIIHDKSDNYGIADAHPIVQAVRSRFATKGIEFSNETLRFVDPIRASCTDDLYPDHPWCMEQKAQEATADRMFENTFAPHPTCFYRLIAHFYYLGKRECLHVEVWRWEKAAATIRTN